MTAAGTPLRPGHRLPAGAPLFENQLRPAPRPFSIETGHCRHSSIGIRRSRNRERAKTRNHEKKSGQLGPVEPRKPGWLRVFALSCFRDPFRRASPTDPSIDAAVQFRVPFSENGDPVDQLGQPPDAPILEICGSDDQLPTVGEPPGSWYSPQSSGVSQIWRLSPFFSPKRPQFAPVQVPSVFA